MTLMTLTKCGSSASGWAMASRWSAADRHTFERVDLLRHVEDLARRVVWR